MNAIWVKSSFSFSNGNCVEVAALPGGSVGVRDSRNPAGPVLRFTRDGWDTFLTGARRGKLEVPSARRLESAPGAGPAWRRAIILHFQNLKRLITNRP